MDVSKCTPGPWTSTDEPALEGSCAWPRIEARDPHGKVVFLFEEFNNTAADRELVSEAGTVAHETGLSPRQLAEQRADLLEIVRGLLDNCAIVHNQWGDGSNKEVAESFIRRAKAACK